MSPQSRALFVIKVRSSSKIPDFYQIRDERFVLRSYCRLDRAPKDLDKLGLGGKEEEFRHFLQTIPFGLMRRIRL